MPTRSSPVRLFLVGLLLAAASLAQAQERPAGVLLLAHGAHAAPASGGHVAGGHSAHAATGHGHHTAHGSVWNRNVEEVARMLSQRFPTEVAFGMAKPRSIQAAVQRLEANGVWDITVVPLFVSSHRPITNGSVGTTPGSGVDHVPCAPGFAAAGELPAQARQLSQFSRKTRPSQTA